jgi:3-methyladenine DNA glycosylase/8-oxoguanine DNA glycosylase
VAPSASASPEVTLALELRGPLELAATLAPLAHGRADPTIRLAPREAWRATRTPDGPATLRLVHELAGRLLVQAWGPGAAAAAAAAGALVGELDNPGVLQPQHRAIRELVRRHPGLRLPRSGQVLEALVPAILEQKVTGAEARRAFRALIARHGEPAPGPGGLRLQPSASALAALPYHAYHPLGVERRRAEVIRAAAARAALLEAAPTAGACGRLLRAIPGIGAWTEAEVLRVAWGDPDAVSVGDYHLPSLVGWVLAGERDADDARMLELLAPYAGQRGRVQRLIEAGDFRRPRHGPRMEPRSISAI